MIEAIGNYSLSAGVLIAASGVFASIVAVRFQAPKWVGVARWSIVLILMSLTVASGALLAAIVQDQFRFEYVASYSERALPIGYKIAAFWAGQQGSLLLWGWLLSLLCVIALWGFRRWHGTDCTVTIAVLAGICGFFAALILLVANPFALISGGVPSDGRGLNPQLQDPGMIIHPPLLFLGYAGFTIPFAIMIGTLVHGRRGNRWLIRIRRWTLVSWVFLTAGIVIGAWWAYIELGWGGYWAWDPVENASLLPWFTSTALIHSIMVQRHRGMFKWWNISLILLTFVLCIFGTYITRSGVIDSVHAFGESSIGNFFLALMGICIASTIGLAIWRRKMLRSEHRLNGIISREGAFLLGNVLLVVMMTTTLIGTIFPLLSGVFVENPVTVKAPFYNKVVVPMALVLVFVMAHGPVLAFGRSRGKTIAQAMILPGIFAGAVSLGVVWIMRKTWIESTRVILTTETFSEELKNEFSNARISVLVTFIAALGTGAVVVGLLRSVSARRTHTGEGFVAATVRLIDKDHRRYGGQMVHLGLMLVVIGVAGSSLFHSEQVYRLHPGESVEIGSNTMTLESLDERYETNYGAVLAVVTMTHKNGSTRTMYPQRRFYNGWEDQPNSQVAVHSTWRRDVYLSLVGWEQGGEITAIQVLMNPLVLWIWIGGTVMLLGGVLCCTPQLLPKRCRSTETVGHQLAQAHTTAEHPIGSPLAGDTT